MTIFVDDTDDSGARRKWSEILPSVAEVEWKSPPAVSEAGFRVKDTTELITGPGVVIVHPPQPRDVLGRMADFARGVGLYIVTVHGEWRPEGQQCDPPFA